MKQKTLKDHLKKLWWFIWEDNSPASWVVNVILAFVLIKYGLYPALGAILGTTYPVVAVMSGSMEHDTALDEWWQEQCCSDALCTTHRTQGALYEANKIDKEKFLTYPFPKGFNKGDIMVLVRPKKLKQGDILVFSAPLQPEPIIHRLISVEEEKYKTKGDNNCNLIGFEEKILPKQTIGKAVLRIPYLGWIKIIFVEILKTIGAA
ncbi:MAG: hypothetical protein HY363_03880 [Candidatus Aenigmarchaeota archaeon]|nr:hypothetical protein [Candidatus Aenigmarchaeota archaeon]